MTEMLMGCLCACRYHYMLARDPVTGSFSDYAEWLGNRTDVVGNFHGQWIDPVTQELESV